MKRFRAIFVLIVSFVPVVTPEFSVKSVALNDSIPGCLIETILPRNASKGVIIHDKMPDSADSTKVCRTVLRSPPGKMLSLTWDLAHLKDKRDSVRIEANNNIWKADKTCEPCLRGVIETNEVTVDFLLKEGSKFRLRYSVIEMLCPFLEIKEPLFVASQAPVSRAVGSKLQLQCITDSGVQLIGASTLSCEPIQDGLPKWSARLPSCRRVSNCPQVAKLSETSGILNFRHMGNENYDCAWLIGASDYEVDHVEFTPTFQWRNLIPPRESTGPPFARARGLFFQDGIGRLSIASVSGKRHKTRDSKLKIYFKLHARELASAGDASFSVQYDISKKTCPGFPDDSIRFGYVSLSDSVFVGSEAEFSCASGYKLVGKPGARCTSGGNWDFARMPRCVPLTDADTNINEIAVTLRPDMKINQSAHILQNLEPERTTESYPGAIVPSTPSAVTVQPQEEDENSEGTEGPRLEEETSTEQSGTTENSTVPPSLAQTASLSNGTTSNPSTIFEWIVRVQNIDMSKPSDKLFSLYCFGIVAAIFLILVVGFLVFKY